MVPVSVSATLPNYIIDGETVYIDNPNIFIAATPHTSTGGWVFLNFTSKRLEGSVDLLFGFDREKGLPTRLELYNPHNEYTPRSYVIPSRYFTNKTFYRAEYTYASQDAIYLYNGYVKLSDNYNGTWVVSWEHGFERAEKATKTVYWTDVKHVTWVSVAEKVDITRVDHVYGGMNRWYQVRADVVKGRQYYLRFWLGVLPSLRGGVYEYFIGVKPSAKSLKEAISSGQFYYLDPWWDNSWSYKRKLTIDQTKVDADLTDFPVLVRLTSARVDWSKVQDDLDDLRFMDSTETTVLKAELEKYTVNDEAWVWVKVPAVSGTVDTDFYMYYGNAGAASAWDAANVWAADAVMVQHMVDATTSTILDSTINSNDGTKKAANEPIVTTSGKIDSALSFDGVNDYVSVPDAASLHIFGDDWTITLCINIHQLQSKTVFSKSSGAGSGIVRLETWDTGYFICGLYDGTTWREHPRRAYTLNEWLFVAITRVASTNKCVIWVNNAATEDIFDLNEAGINPLNTLFIGAANAGVNFFDGIIDEVRIYNAAKSAAWTKADYNSGADTLITYGAETENTYSITITSSPATGIGFVIVDGGAISTPHVYTWTYGDNHTLEALSPVTIVTGQSRYAYTSWSDGGAQSHTYTVPGADETVTATYHIEYFLTLTTSPATGPIVTGGGWYDSGINTTLTATTPYVSGNNVYVFYKWTWKLGGVTQNAMTANPTNITMTNYSSAIGVYSSEAEGGFSGLLLVALVALPMLLLVIRRRRS